MSPLPNVAWRLRRSGLVLLAISIMVGALLPSAVFAYTGEVPIERGMRPVGNYGAQSQHNYNSRTNYQYSQPQQYNYSKSYSNHGQMNYGNDYHNQYQKNYGYGYDNHGSGKAQYSHGCDQRYRVHWGDNLSRIARRYGTSVYALSTANGIHNPNRIYAGENLCIPQGYGYHR